MRVRTGPAERAGFTLVELTVTLGIIATLAALLLGAVTKARDLGKRTQAATEISQLETAVAKFKVDFGFNPPHYVVFPQVGAGAGSGPTAVEQEKGYRILQRMFRAYDNTTPAGSPVVTFRGASNQNGPLTLVGVQSLAFFLGGPNQTGFKPNLPQDPAGSTSGKPPYYNFDQNRFIDPDSKQPTVDYRDTWGTPYAYFSAGASTQYDLSHPWPIPGRSDVLGPFRIGGTATSPWAAPGQVQIISAGPDGEFGTFYSGQSRVSEWQPGVGQYSDTSVGGDDLSNFNRGVPLGTTAK